MLILASTVIGCVSISAFASLVSIPVGIMSSAVGIKVCAITAGIKKYKSVIKKKRRKKHDKIVLLEKNTIEVLISKALIDSYISHDKFVSVNNVLREYNEMKEEIKNPETYCVSRKKYTTNKNSIVRKTKQNRLMLLPNCGKKKSTFIKNQELHSFNAISND